MEFLASLGLLFESLLLHSISSVSDFGIQLVSSVHAFKTAGKSCCWITVPLDFAHFIPIAAQQVKLPSTSLLILQIALFPMQA